MQTIVLLHGALGAPQDLEPLAKALAGHGLKPLSFPFSGHASTGFSESFGIPAFTSELHDFIKTQAPGGASVFGYSMGGYVALNLALEQESLIHHIITLGTKFNWSKETVEKETAALNPELLQQKIPAFAASLEEKHGTAWKELVLKTAELMREIHALDLLNAASLKTITTKTLVGLGDRDKMVSLEETVNVYKALPNASMYLLPGTKHPVETVNTALFSKMIADFVRPADF